jgi:ArsR family transcriptional regulator
MDRQQAEQLAGLLRVLGDPGRLQLLALIASHPDGEACACNLIERVGLSQPTVSHHLKVLYEAGLLEREKRGRWAYYKIVSERFHRLTEMLGG